MYRWPTPTFSQAWIMARKQRLSIAVCSAVYIFMGSWVHTWSNLQRNKFAFKYCGGMEFIVLHNLSFLISEEYTRRRRWPCWWKCKELFFQSNLVLKYGYFSLPMKMFANIFLVAYIIFAPVRPCVTLAFYINLFFSSLLEHFWISVMCKYIKCLMNVSISWQNFLQ